MCLHENIYNRFPSQANMALVLLLPFSLLLTPNYREAELNSQYPPPTPPDQTAHRPQRVNFPLTNAIKSV